MKKVIFSCVLFSLVWVLTGCEKAPECKFHKKTIDLPVNQNQWQYDDQTKRFYAHFTLPEITADIYDYGTWIFTREYNVGTQNAFQVALPESTFMQETLDDGSIVNYTQHIDYAIGIGWAEVTYTISDFFYPQDQEGYLIQPEAMNFHLQLNY